ncbi:outer spore coat protein CotE [Mammaliicoccus sciuri]|uniref:Spore coat protein E n=2 Tax=Sporosarcina newyorkensis TaxID=759851 RepID=A0A1T4YDD8_9BACL|nr:outer spore coat protein CotE [Sporosarcina newyorkensis]EGQ27445.1 spore coat protein E [Sporosarcina newyorkensis 2681]SKA99832.1 spore coat protein E [Sporosarcina newyorkensis]
MTKAVIAKGKHRSDSTVTLKPPNRPSSILGCWVINHTHQAKKVGNHVEVTGSFDVNVWYSHHDHSKTSVFTESIPYKDKIALHYRDEPTSSKEETIVTVLQHPNCTEASISECGQNFSISIERELLVEMVGETKVSVTIHPHPYEEEWPIAEAESSSVVMEDKKANEPHAKEPSPHPVRRKDSPF